MSFEDKKVIKELIEELKKVDTKYPEYIIIQ